MGALALIRWGRVGAVWNNSNDADTILADRSSMAVRVGEAEEASDGFLVATCTITAMARRVL